MEDYQNNSPTSSQWKIAIYEQAFENVNLLQTDGEYI